jgi:hypothetical protein
MTHSGQSARLAHVVLFAFRPEAPATERERIIREFGELPGQIEQVRSFEHGANCSPENLHHGFEHCFTMRFSDEAGRDAYLVHPAHAAFVQRLQPWIEKALVVDYWAS